MTKILDTVKIGSFIKNIREVRSYKQKEFAGILDIGLRRLRSIEKGEKLPDFLMVIKCCNYFDICADDFIIYVE